MIKRLMSMLKLRLSKRAADADQVPVFRLVVQPGDVLVLITPAPLTHAHAEQIISKFIPLLPENHVVVMHGDWQFGSISVSQPTVLEGGRGEAIPGLHQLETVRQSGVRKSPRSKRLKSDADKTRYC